MFDLLAFLEKHAKVVSKDSKGEIFLEECPFCGAPKTHTTSFSVSSTKKLYHCFRCGRSGKLPSLVMKLAGVSFDRAQEIIGDDLGLGREQRAEKPKVEQIQLPVKSPWTRRALDYLKSRDITEKTIQEFGLYYCGVGKFRERIVIPIALDGRVITFQARSIFPKHEVRYRSPYGAPKILFNLDRYEKGMEVVLPEGPFDVLRLHQNGVYATCPLGKNIGEEHVRLMIQKGVRRVLLMYDPDAAQWLENVWKALSMQLDVKIVPLVGTKDPGDMDRKETQVTLQNRCENAASANWSRFQRWKKARA